MRCARLSCAVHGAAEAVAVTGQRALPAPHTPNMGRPRREGLGRRAGTGRQCTGRGFCLDLMPLPSAPPSAACTPALQLQPPAGAAPSPSAATSSQRTSSFATPMEGVPERLFFKTPGCLSRLGRTPQQAPASLEDMVGMTPMEGVPERIIRRPPSTVRKLRRLSPAPGSFPRLQSGQNTAPSPGPTPAGLPRPAFGASPAAAGGGSPASTELGGSAHRAELRLSPGEPAQLRSRSADESDGNDDHGFHGSGDDMCGEGAPLHLLFLAVP